MPEGGEEIQLIKIRGGEGAVVPYANVCNIGVSPEEAFLHFAQRDPDNPAEANSVTQVCLSIAHAKRLAIALGNTIATYESMFGEVVADTVARLKPEVREQLGLDTGKGKEDAR